MIEKEISEIRRRTRRDRSNMTAMYGCFVSENKEVVSKFRLSTSLMPENEGDKYFDLMKKILSGSVGKNLIDIAFRTQQVVDSPEHKLLMQLRETKLKDGAILDLFYQKVIESVTMNSGYLILIGCDVYDVPFKSGDGVVGPDAEVFQYLLCAICPVKFSKSALEYEATEKAFRGSAIAQQLSAPALGFMFPAFDNRSTNIYNALMYTKDAGDAHEAFVTAVFNTTPAMAADVQKKTFDALLRGALDSECQLDVLQRVYDEISTMIQLHRESRRSEPLMIGKETIKAALDDAGVSEESIARFSVQYDSAFGYEAELFAKNLIDEKRFEVNTSDVTIRVTPGRNDLLETRVIGGVKYILVCTDDDVEVNGVPISITEN